MATNFPTAPSPYSISPEAYIALSQLNLQQPAQQGGTPISSYGLTQGTPATQSTTQAALQQALQASLSGGTANSLQSLVQSMINNPDAARQYAGSLAPEYTPKQPADAWRLDFNGNGGWGGGEIGRNKSLWSPWTDWSGLGAR